MSGAAMGIDQRCHGRPARGQTTVAPVGFYYGGPLCGMLLALLTAVVPRAAPSSGEIPMARSRHIADSLIIPRLANFSVIERN